MLSKVTLKLALGGVTLLLAELLQADGRVDSRVLEIGVGGTFAYIIIKLVLDFLRNRDNTHDGRTNDYEPNNGIAFSRELVAVLADIKQGLSDGRREAHEQHEQQIKLMTEMVTRLRMRN